MLNALFPPQWGAALNADWTLAFRGAVEQGDAKCAPNYALHGAQSIPNQLALEQPQHPFDDDWHRDHSVRNIVDRINVPVLGVQSYQDEQTGPRGSSFWDQLDPEKTWLITTNGHHSMYAASDQLQQTLDGFYGHFLKGERNGFERTPRVQIWHETTYDGPKPRSITTRARLPVSVVDTAIPLGPDGLRPSTPGDSSSFDYPIPSPPITDETPAQITQPRVNTWGLIPDPGLGRSVFTTAPMAKTVTTWGPASADLSVSTTAPDVDLQVTMTEVRPDGQETYVQRGWLRASHRAVDEQRSTPTRPWHPHTEASVKDMPIGEPQMLRLEMLPSGHTFRAGSSIRIYVEMPSVTGGWGFTNILTPQRVTVHQSGSRLVLGLLRDAQVKADLPACGELYYQPCRRSPVAAPAGTLDIAPPPVVAPGSRGPAVQARFYGRRGRHVLVRVRSLDGRNRKVTVELRRGTTRIARSARFTAGPRLRRVALKRSGGRRFATGRYRLIVRSSSSTVLLKRSVRLGR